MNKKYQNSDGFDEDDMNLLGLGRGVDEDDEESLNEFNIDSMFSEEAKKKSSKQKGKEK